MTFSFSDHSGHRACMLSAGIAYVHNYVVHICQEMKMFFFFIERINPAIFLIEL